MTSKERNLPELLREAERRLNQFLFHGASPDFARIPADRDHDIDLLLVEAANEIETLERIIRESVGAKEAVKLRAVLKAYRDAEWQVTPGSSADRDRVLDLVDEALDATFPAETTLPHGGKE